ncbi:MAG: F0F1 ATP synthase subunit alpha, partial [Isosphaeraceae bacterium]
LKQPQYSPYPVERQVVSIWAGTNGYLDDVPLEDVGRFEREFLDYVQRERSGIYDSIREARDLSDDTASGLKEAIEDFRKGFTISAGDQLLVQEEPAEPIDESEIERETVKKRVRASNEPK